MSLSLWSLKEVLTKCMIMTYLTASARTTTYNHGGIRSRFPLFITLLAARIDVNTAAADIFVLGIFVGDCNVIRLIRVRAASMSTPTERVGKQRVHKCENIPNLGLHGTLKSGLVVVIMLLYLSLMEGRWIFAAKISRCEGCDVSLRFWGPLYRNRGRRGSCRGRGRHSSFKGMSQLVRGSDSTLYTSEGSLVRAVDLVVACELHRTSYMPTKLG